jgi:L-alanine-DL-glutamate epimerase-like enolase superfamily enzyme
VCVRVRGRDGREAEGWGETPLSVQWVWPSALPYEERYEALCAFTRRLVAPFAAQATWGHALELGHAFLERELSTLTARFNAEERAGREAMPHLAALVCASAFDLALHDAYGVLHERPVYETYDARFIGRDLSHFLEPASPDVSFAGKFPADFLAAPTSLPRSLPAWHLVGGLDALGLGDLRGDEPSDGQPVLLTDWIRRDGLRCLKLKLRGHDAAWDHQRIVDVGRLALEHGVDWLSLDFNCTVTDPAYVTAELDRLRDEHPRLHGMILYVEQPFPYDLEVHRIDVHTVSARKPLFMDESAHDWRLVRLGRSLGWTGVALKTCKTQTGALLSLCWARAHGMTLMVQDLTNPMLAMIPHALLAAHAGTIMGVETNASQFYPAASAAEAAIHPGLYQRRDGRIDLSSLRGPGFGYVGAERARPLPAPEATS